MPRTGGNTREHPRPRGCLSRRWHRFASGIGLRSPSTIQRAARLASLVNTREHALTLGASPEHLREDFEAALGDRSPNCSGLAIFVWISHTDLCTRETEYLWYVGASLPSVLVHTIPLSYYWFIIGFFFQLLLRDNDTPPYYHDNVHTATNHLHLLLQTTAAYKYHFPLRPQFAHFQLVG